MKTFNGTLLAMAMCLILILSIVQQLSWAEDIDIYGSPTNSSTNPNILIVIDNSSNWNAGNQQWPDNIKQGEGELAALRQIATELTADVNVGLMLFTDNSPNGSYVRYHMRPMTPTNVAALRELIGDTGSGNSNTCVNGSTNSLNGTPNCLYRNFNSNAEQIPTGQVDYSATMFETFKYFGGYTNPANANTDIAGSPTSATRYGPFRYAGGTTTPEPLSDAAAYTGGENKPQYTLNVSSCAKNYIIFIGNGFPPKTNDLNATFLSGVGGDTTRIPNAEADVVANNADEWARFLNRTDCSSAPGQQNVKTYTIDVYNTGPADPAQRALLRSMAASGGGKYFAASDNDQILNAMRQILSEIQSVNSVFASSSLPVNANAQGTYLNQVFIGMFRPDSSGKPRWQGNLKQYQFGFLANTLKLVDNDTPPKEAVSLTTGFMSTCAKSFWSSDSGTYWDYPTTTTKGSCTAETSRFPSAGSSSIYSDWPDGDVVEKGGAAQRLRGVTLSTTTPPTIITSTNYATRALKTCDGTTCISLTDFNTANTAITATLLGVATSTDRGNLIDWVRGRDIDDENGNSVTAEMRPSALGDVVHSQPGVVDYGGTTGVVAFYGGNDGALHAINGKQGASDGNELWGFVAPETFGKLKRLKDNSPYVSLPGVSASLTPAPTPKDYFFDGSIGVHQKSSTVWIYPTMRRGGRAIYAFDVSTPMTPSIKWRKGCYTSRTDNDTDCSTGWASIGQTWSKPQIGFLSGYVDGSSNPKPVLVFGGGYDTCEDTDSQTRCTTTPRKGANIWFVDADTGTIIRTYPTNYSVPGDVVLVKDNNGNIANVYAGDTGGYVYRINVGTWDGSTATSWTSNSAASNITIANLSETNHARKFMSGPDVVETASYNAVLIGSGDRERPLLNNYPCGNNSTAAGDFVKNQFYMIKDTPTGYPVTPTVRAELTNAAALTCSTINAKGWYFDLPNSCEQVVNKATSLGGVTYFGTNQPIPTPPGSCSTNLGVARGYAVKILTGCALTGTDGARSTVLIGGGLPPSPVAGIVDVDGKLTPFGLGLATVDNPLALGGSEIIINPPGTRARTYWYKK